MLALFLSFIIILFHLPTKVWRLISKRPLYIFKLKSVEPLHHLTIYVADNPEIFFSQFVSWRLNLNKKLVFGSHYLVETVNFWILLVNKLSSRHVIVIRRPFHSVNLVFLTLVFLYCRFPRKPEVMVTYEGIQLRMKQLEEYLFNLLNISIYRNHHETVSTSLVK